MKLNTTTYSYSASREEIHFLILSAPPFSNRREKTEAAEEIVCNKCPKQLITRKMLEQLETEIAWFSFGGKEPCTLSARAPKAVSTEEHGHTKS